MAQQTNDTLKGFFENGDTITATTFGDLIDSYLSLVETSAQTVTSPITISAVSFIQASGTRMQAQETDVSALNVTGSFSADAGSINFSTLSASAINVKTTISASAAYCNSLLLGGLPYGDAGIRSFVSTWDNVNANVSSSVVGTVQQAGYGGGDPPPDVKINLQSVSSNVSVLTRLSAWRSNSFKYKGANGNRMLLISSGDYGGPDEGGGGSEKIRTFIGKSSAARPVDEQYKLFGSSEFQLKQQTNSAATSENQYLSHCLISAETSVVYMAMFAIQGTSGKRYSVERRSLTLLEF